MKRHDGSHYPDSGIVPPSMGDSFLSAEDYAQPGWAATTPQSMHGHDYGGFPTTEQDDTALIPAYNGNEMPTVQLDRVQTGNGVPIPQPPRILGPRGGTDTTQPIPRQGDDRPTETLRAVPAENSGDTPKKYHPRHARAAGATVMHRTPRRGWF